MPRNSPPLSPWPATTKIPGAEPHPEPFAKRVENASLVTFSGHLKGGVHDARLSGPVYIEDEPPSKHVHDIYVETCVRKTAQGFGAS